MFKKTIGFGANTIGGYNLYHDYNFEQSVKVLSAYLNNGGKIIDTAYVYGLGEGEIQIGKMIKDYPRESLFLITKAAHVLQNDGTLKLSNDSSFLSESVYQALKRLDTHYIDVFFIHFPDLETFSFASILALRKLKNEGLIRHIGVSNFNLELLKIANQEGDIDFVENKYNLLYLKDEADVIPYCIDHRIHYIPYTPLARGLLTGKYNIDTQIDTKDRRFHTREFQSPRYEKICNAIDQIKHLETKYQAQLSQIVLSWTLRQKGITCLIPGAKTVSQVLTNINAVNICLSEEDQTLIRNTFSNL